MKKITQTLLLLMFSYASMCAQVTVKSTKVTVEEAKTAELNNRFEEYEVIEIDLSQFKRNITSLEETRVLWTFGEQTKYDMRIYPKDIRFD